MKQKLISLLTLLLCVCSGAWGQTTYNLTGYSTSILNGWTHNYGNIYVGRKGSNYTPDANGLPTGNSNIFAAFQVATKSKIKVVFVWTKTSGDLSNKKIDLASITETDYNKIVTASTNSTNDVKYSISDFSSSQDVAVAINRSNANTEVEFELPNDVNAGYYAVYTAGSINGNALLKKIIVTPSTPTLTGTWKVGESVVTEGEINKGDAVPSLSFVPSSSNGSTPDYEDYTITYASTNTDVVGITGGGTGFELKNTTVGTATLTATLETNDDAKYLDAASPYSYTFTVNKVDNSNLAISPATGTYVGKTTVTLSAEDGYFIYFTTDGSDPETDPNGTRAAFSGPFEVTATATVKAIAYKAGEYGNLLEAAYTINAPATPTFTPTAGEVLSGTEISIVSADGGDATIYYTTNGTTPDSGSTPYDAEAKPTITAATTIKAISYVNGVASAVAEATYTIAEMLTQKTVTESRIWDWSNLSAVGELTGSTTPSITSEFVMANMDGLRYPNFNLGFNSNFTVEMAREIVISNTQYVRRSGNGNTFQNGTIKISFGVPGALNVYFTGTSSSNQNGENARYLVVNGKKGSIGTENTTQKNETFAVNGDVVISFETAKPLRIQKLVFTPLEGTSATISHNYATFSHSNACALAVPDGVSAFGVSDTDEDHVTLTKYDVIPANTGVILYSESKTDVEFEGTNTSSTYAAANYMVPVTDNGTNVPENSYVLAWDKHNSKVVFAKVTSTTATLNKGKAYLTVPATARFNTLFLGEDSETTGISSVTSQADNRFYNLRGQRVAQPQKGLYIVNGKKVVIK